jgi:oxygen-independent coproporphyrinogen III oxidase
MQPRSLYVHVPFCARRCGYCDFAVEANAEPPVDGWLRAISAELALVARERAWSGPLELDTLYVGGGTPSLLGPEAMARLLEGLRPYAKLREGAEWTCEANPESFTLDLARDWRAAGVNRLSLGAQTFDPAALRWMGRLHGPDGPARALEAARGAGFQDVGLDLIFGLPGHLGRDWRADLARAVELAPEHISLYGLTAEAGAPLGRRVAEGREALADEDRYAEEYLLAHERLVAAGYEHYEVSNFARGGRRSRHNVVYWTGAPYAALGPGAHGFQPPHRTWNVRSWPAYRSMVESGVPPVEGQEEIDSETAALEAIWLGLRTAEGFRIRAAGGRTTKLVSSWVRAGLASECGERVRLTAAGWLLLDQLAVELHALQGPPGSAPNRKRRMPIDAAEPLVQISANPNRSPL